MHFQRFSFVFVLACLTGITSSCLAQRPPAGAITTKTVGHISEIVNLAEARASHTSTLLNDGRVLIAGGMERNGVYFDTAEIFDPGSNRFGPEISMTHKRVSHSATLLSDGRVLLAGGWPDPV